MRQNRILDLMVVSALLLVPGRLAPAQSPVSPTPTGTEQAWLRPEAPPEPHPPGMVWIPPGRFRMGSDAPSARPDERPAHVVRVSGFFMDRHEVINAAFRRFVQATGYRTVAERPVDPKLWAAEGPPPTPEDLAPGSLVFVSPPADQPARSYTAWWRWQKGASWRAPHGPGSDLRGKDRHPVVHVAYEDALAYARWAGKGLPTEAQWERAARGGLKGKLYPWGDDPVFGQEARANIWQGAFPYRDEKRDGYSGTAPVGSFPANPFGLHDMAGNVWEWCRDLYHPATYRSRRGKAPLLDPRGPSRSWDPQEPGAVKRTIRGGSFLCQKDVCSGYRASARMKTTPDSGMEHLGFRCVMTPAQWAARRAREKR